MQSVGEGETLFSSQNNINNISWLLRPPRFQSRPAVYGTHKLLDLRAFSSAAQGDRGTGKEQ